MRLKRFFDLYSKAKEAVVLARVNQLSRSTLREGTRNVLKKYTHAAVNAQRCTTIISRTTLIEARGVESTIWFAGVWVFPEHENVSVL